MFQAFDWIIAWKLYHLVFFWIALAAGLVGRFLVIDRLDQLSPVRAGFQSHFAPSSVQLRRLF